MRKFDNSDTYTDAEVENFKREWRWAHRATSQFWKDLRRAALQSVHTGQRIELGKLSFAMEDGTLRMVLPSGRTLAYPEARLGPGKFEGTREIYFKDNAKGATRRVLRRDRALEYLARAHTVGLERWIAGLVILAIGLKLPVLAGEPG